MRLFDIDCLSQGAIRRIDQDTVIGRDGKPVRAARKGDGARTVWQGDLGRQSQGLRGRALQADDKERNEDYEAHDHDSRENCHQDAQDAQVLRFYRLVYVVQSGHLRHCGQSAIAS